MKHELEWEAYKKTKDANALVLLYMRFAQSIGIKAGRRLPSSVSRDDVEGAALEGLWHAITRFDTTKGVPFEAFARKIINGRIFDYIRDDDVESRSLRTLQKQYEKAENQLMHELHRMPTDTELAERLGSEAATVHEYRSRIRKSYATSLDVETHGLYSEGDTLASRLAGQNEDTTPHNLLDMFQMMIAPWTKPERLLFALVYLEEFGLDKAANMIGVAHTQACQINYRMGEQLRRLTNTARKDHADL
jgi:RNA polymerase sigma factor FliA